MAKRGKKTVILYHGNCPDGFGGAWAARKKFGKRADYIPVPPETLPEMPLKDKEIYVLDNSFPENVFRKLAKENKSVVVMDHHESSKSQVIKFPQNVYSANHSGAGLAWRYFHPKKKTPKLLKYVEDYDLWRFKLPHSREVNAYISVYNFNFRVWDKLYRELENPGKFREAVKKGKLILTHKERLISRIAGSSARLVKFERRKVWVINSPVFEDQLGNIMAEKNPPMAVIWHQSDKHIKFSLRSVGSFDVSKVAKKYGGGGHRRSAGFKLPKNAKLPWKSVA